MATGLLVVAVGAATRFLQYLSLEPKVYEATIKFGQTTNSMDAEGLVVDERPLPVDLLNQITTHLGQFVGEIEQIPPMYSAVKIGGQPLYKMARKGESIDRAARKITVDSFEVISVTNEILKARIACSGGTYIRSLANDLGAAVGCGAHLVGLRRTHLGLFDTQSSTCIENAAVARVIPLREALKPMPLIELNVGQVTDTRQGRKLSGFGQLADGLFALADESQQVFAIGQCTGGSIQPVCVIPVEAMGGV